jgi:hypothetical protein
MHPRQAALLEEAAELTDKLAAGGSPVLWKYVDGENGEFFLPSRRQNVHSPYSGKSIPQRPEKFQIPAVSKELKEQQSAPSGAPGPKSGAPKAKPKKRATDLDWKVQPKA